MNRLPQINLNKYVPKDLKQTRMAIRDGWQTGKRCAKIHNKSLPCDVYIRSKSVCHNIKKTNCGLPSLLAIACFPIPVPGTMIAGFCLGLAIKKLVKFVR